MKSLRNPQCMSELLSRLKNVRADTPRRWGKMTAPQMICHLNDAFLGVMGEKPMEIPQGFSLWPLMKWVSLYAPMKWPPGVPTRPEFDQVKGHGTPPVQFEADMSCLIGSMKKFAAQPRTIQLRPHPLFKEMSERDWMRWGYLHVDHHLRQFGQ
jgi:hypothetical protein